MPFRCVGRRGRALRPRRRLHPPQKAALLCRPSLQGFNNNRHGGGNVVMPGIHSMPRLLPHAPLGASLRAAARTPPQCRPGHTAPNSPGLPLPPRRSRAGAGNPVHRSQQGGGRAAGRSEELSRRQWCNILPLSEESSSTFPWLCGLDVAREPYPEYLRQ